MGNLKPLVFLLFVAQWSGVTSVPLPSRVHLQKENNWQIGNNEVRNKAALATAMPTHWPKQDWHKNSDQWSKGQAMAPAPALATEMPTHWPKQDWHKKTDKDLWEEENQWKDQAKQDWLGQGDNAWSDWQYVKQDEQNKNWREKEMTKPAQGAAAMKASEGMIGSHGSFGGVDATVDSMEVGITGLKFEMGHAAGGKEGGGGHQDLASKPNQGAAAMAYESSGGGGAEGGTMSSIKYSIEKMDMKLNGLKISMGGGEGMKGLAEGSARTLHEIMMKAHLKNLENTESTEDDTSTDEDDEEDEDKSTEDDGEEEEED